ncbi:MAG: (2Fe-2S)-binding protein [Curvibacter sp.]
MAVRRFGFRVNGVEREVEAAEGMPLLYALRHELGLKGTRFGCGAQQCGACHVLIDGQSLPSCDAPLWSVAGKSVLTVEGLSEDGRLHPLQQAFLDEQAGQCAYCLSGMLISALALLQKEPQPDEARVRAVLDPHLCRCGSHQRIVRAVLRAAQTMREPA